MLKTSDMIRNVIEEISDEWHTMSSEEKTYAIMHRTWIEFEVATSVRTPNYTLVPVDFYERIALAVDKNKCTNQAE